MSNIVVSLNDPLPECAHCANLRAQLAQRDSEIARLREDAKRYRFMRAAASVSDGKGKDEADIPASPEFFDATIDAAIAAADSKGDPNVRE